MSKSAIGHLAQLLRDNGWYTEEQYVSYEKSKDIIQMGIMDESLRTEYGFGFRINTDKIKINVYSPLNNDREQVYAHMDSVMGYLESVLNEHYDGGMIKHITNVRTTYRGVTTEKAIVYVIEMEMDSETILH